MGVELDSDFGADLLAYFYETFSINRNSISNNSIAGAIRNTCAPMRPCSVCWRAQNEAVDIRDVQPGYAIETRVNE